MGEPDSTVYQDELKKILLTWVFSFACSNCMLNDTNPPSSYKYISKLEKGNKNDGTYSRPPTLWCGCDEMLYPLKSRHLYDLFISLYDIDENDYIMIKSPGMEEEESSKNPYDL